MRQHNQPHPGEFIQSVYLDPYADKISRSEIASKLGVARPTFNRLVNGQSNISPEMAIRLSKVLGGSAQSWLNMQTNYDLHHAEKRSKLSQLKKLDFERLTA
ncbi:MAG TPA: addiction module antidote protein, HigA family [Gammaproteobacteria bacterium]|nr:addiction module antidote protein, HigA family [Gammaproteobacteria bacterium]